MLDQYFALGDHFDQPSAFCVKAAAHLALGDTPAALAAYEAAVAREARGNCVYTQAGLLYARLIVSDKSEHLYLKAVEALGASRNRLLIPADNYQALGADAVILKHCGMDIEARESAELALEFACKRTPLVANTPKLGQMPETGDDFYRKIKAISEG